MPAKDDRPQAGWPFLQGRARMKSRRCVSTRGCHPKGNCELEQRWLGRNGPSQHGCAARQNSHSRTVKFLSRKSQCIRESGSLPVKGQVMLAERYPTTIRCVGPNSPHLQLALGSCCKDECHESHLVETDVMSAEVRCVVERWNVVQFGSLITLQRLDSRCSDQRAQTILATIRIAR